MPQLKQASEYLRSNRLSEVAQQIALSSERTVSDFDGTKMNLEKLYSKLVQIEGEKDRERRLTKQREWVCVLVRNRKCSMIDLLSFLRRVIEEILHTEEAYSADLKLVVEVCQPLYSWLRAV